MGCMGCMGFSWLWKCLVNVGHACSPFLGIEEQTNSASFCSLPLPAQLSQCSLNYVHESSASCSDAQSHFDLLIHVV